jgi:hypothetical protein
MESKKYYLLSTQTLFQLVSVNNLQDGEKVPACIAYKPLGAGDDQKQFVTADIAETVVYQDFMKKISCPELEEHKTSSRVNVCAQALDILKA